MCQSSVDTPRDAAPQIGRSGDADATGQADLHEEESAMNAVKYVRLFAGPDGESHFEELTLDLNLRSAAPPAPPLLVSDWQSAERMNFASFPVGWRGEDVRAAKPTFVTWLAGSCAVQTSDGEIRHFHVGDVVLVEDSTGKGHCTWNEGDNPVLAAAIQLPQ
jgi:hypothetical protein